ENEEAIESGAFWFYRKLRFRSTDPDLRALTSREEQRIASNPEHRSSPAVLRRLASKNLLYEIAPNSRSSNPKSKIQNPKSSWDRFHIRNLGLAVIRRMALEFGGDAEKIRRASERRVAASLDLPIPRAESLKRRVFSDLALVLDLIPDLSRWPRAVRV